jgi:hypothetical protein
MTAIAELNDYSRVNDQLQIEERLLGYLRSKNYTPIMRFLKTNCARQFRTEHSGETFEYWVDWCARNAGNVEDAKRVLCRLFAQFYRQLPAFAKENLSYLADEIGFKLYSTRRAAFHDLYRVACVSATTILTSVIGGARAAVAHLRKARMPQITVSFQQPPTQQHRRIPIEDMIKSSHPLVR